MQAEFISIWPYLLSFIVPGVTALIYLVRKQGTVDARGSLTDYSVATIRADITEVKGDVKEVRREQQELKESVNLMTTFGERVKNLEDTFLDHDRRLWPQVNDALRQLDVLKVRVDDIRRDLDDIRRDKGKSAV
jgi:two-component SAPR family response regulator